MQSTTNRTTACAFNALQPAVPESVLNPLKRLSTFIAARPFSSQVVMSTVKCLCADGIVQTQLEGKRWHEIDGRRMLMFGTFGFAFLGVGQWGIYVTGFRRIFDPKVMDRFCNASVTQKLRDRAGLKQLAGQISIEFFCVQPFIYFPTYYIFKEAIAPKDKLGPTQTEIQPRASVLTSAMHKYRTNFQTDNLGMWTFWLPVDLIIYSCPIHLRLPLNHSISFTWALVLSYFRGGKDRSLDGTSDTSHLPPVFSYREDIWARRDQALREVRKNRHWHMD